MSESGLLVESDLDVPGGALARFGPETDRLPENSCSPPVLQLFLALSEIERPTRLKSLVLGRSDRHSTVKRLDGLEKRQ